MKQIFLIFAFVLMLFARHTPFIQAEIVAELENWSDSDSDASTFLDVSGSTYAYVYYAPGGIYMTPYWAVSGSASASASASSMGDNTEYDAIAWCEGSGDENTSPTPSRDNRHYNGLIRIPVTIVGARSPRPVNSASV